MEFYTEFEKKKNIIRVHNPSNYPYEIKPSVKYEIEEKEYGQIFKDLNFSILKPINNGEDFIYTYTSSHITNLYPNTKIIGCSYKDVFPHAYEEIYSVFKQVYTTHEKSVLNLVIYEGKHLKQYSEMNIFFYQDEILLLINEFTENPLLKENAVLYEINDEVLNHFKVGTYATDYGSNLVFSDGFFKVMGLEKDFNGNHFHDEIWSHIPNYMQYWDICEDYVKGKRDYLNFIFEYIHPKTNDKRFISAYISHFAHGEKNISIGAIQDITDETINKNALIEANEEKTMLIKEVHHRVKNNLAIINSFISLEQRFKKDSPEKIIEITKNRINSLALIHEKIYNEEHLTHINPEEFINDFDSGLKDLEVVDVNFVNDIDKELSLDMDIITPLALLINELTINSFKHAFNSEKEYNEIFKSIKTIEENKCIFHYKDNGKGLDEDFDINSSKSLGCKIIKSLSNQLNGKYEIFNDNGFNFKLIFPLKQD